MKYTIIVILVLTTYVSCKQPSNKIGNTSSNDTLSTSKSLQVIAVNSTTFDSLQGVWKHMGEDANKIKINEDTIFRYLGNDKPDTSFFVLSDSCTQEKSAIKNKTKKGNKILEYSSKTDDVEDYIMCFNIDYLKNDSLILFYEEGSAPKPMLYIRFHLTKQN